MNLRRVKRRMSSSKHPQTDGAFGGHEHDVTEVHTVLLQLQTRRLGPLSALCRSFNNIAVSEDLGLCPFEVDLRRKPRAPLNMLL